MLFSQDQYKFMYAALNEAQAALDENEIPIGAVIVYKNRIIGRGHNQVERLKDPTAHAEILAITAAANHLQNWRLNECDLYVNVEPCVMCTGAAIAARISSLYFSLNEPMLILADEPTGNLDPETSLEILEILKKISSRGTSVIFATHNYELVRKFDTKIIKLENGKALKAVLKQKIKQVS